MNNRNFQCLSRTFVNKQLFLYPIWMIAALIIIVPSLQSQEIDSIVHAPEPHNFIDLSNKIFKPNIKTIQFHRDGWDLSPPMIKFNSSEKLKLSFDDLDADGKEYMFTMVHCDANWKPSEIEKYQYLEGYYEDYIYEFRYSVNTIVPFTHYELVFPTEDVRPSIPGNYVLKVFVENEDSLYFTRRFMLLNQKVNVEAEIKQATTISDRNYKQEIDFVILAPNYQIVNPYRDLKVVITQNNRWDNALFNLKPKTAISGKLDYNYDYENVFNGGSEFRSADFKSLNYYTENIARIEFTQEGYQVYLKPGEKRTFKQYKKDDDINGQFKIKTEDQDNTEIESEYVNVHFSLPYAAPMLEGSFYIFGALSDWTYHPDFKMDYNFKEKKYEKTVLLKQGYYNYLFIFKRDDETSGDETLIEGNHWETQNEYTIWVYNRETGDQFDKLIGVTHINSFFNKNK